MLLSGSELAKGCLGRQLTQAEQSWMMTSGLGNVLVLFTAARDPTLARTQIYANHWNLTWLRTERDHAEGARGWAGLCRLWISQGTEEALPPASLPTGQGKTPVVHTAPQLRAAPSTSTNPTASPSPLQITSGGCLVCPMAMLFFPSAPF